MDGRWKMSTGEIFKVFIRELQKCGCTHAERWLLLKDLIALFPLFYDLIPHPTLQDSEELLVLSRAKPPPISTHLPWVQKQPRSPWLLIHFHGGGFVAQTSKSHEVHYRRQTFFLFFLSVIAVLINSTQISMIIIVTGSTKSCIPVNIN